MKQLHNDNYWANGITAIDILFVLAFIGVIVGGYLISAGRNSGVGAAFTKEEVIRPQEKAMFGTLLMLLKHRKSADGQFN